MRFPVLTSLGVLVVLTMGAYAAKRKAMPYTIKASEPTTQVGLLTDTRPVLPPYAPWPQKAKDTKFPDISQFSDAMPGIMRSVISGLPDSWLVQTSNVDQARGILCSIGVSGKSDDVKYGIGQYLVFQYVGSSSESDKKITDSISYNLVGDFSRDPQFSSDGRKMFLRSGYTGGPNDGFGLLSWNLLSGQTIDSAKAMDNGRQSLSPSARLFATLTVVNTNEYGAQDIQEPWKDNPPGLLMVYVTDRFIIGEGSRGRDSDEVPGKKFITDQAAMRTVVWTSDNRILYTHAPAPDKWIKGPDGVGNLYRATPVITPVIDAPNKYPSVWVANPATKATHQIIERAYDPSPSPDGKFIAFFGWPTTEKPTATKPASVPKLWLYQTATGKTFEVNEQNNGFVGWTRDSKTLVTGRYEGQYKLHVGSLALSDALQGPLHVAALQVEKAVIETNAGGPSVWPHDPIEVRSIARNGRYVVVNTIASATSADTSPSKREYTLQAVDLSDGHISTIAHAKPPDAQTFSWSWFDESDAPSR